MKCALSLIVLALTCLAPDLQAQEPSPEATPPQEEKPDIPTDPQALAKEYSEKFQEGIDALPAGEYDKGIAAFKRCLELVPKESTCAYNVACGYSLKGELDNGFEWLGNAAKWGFGDADGNIDHAANKDTDLANLRADERFAGIIQLMKDRNAEIEEYWSTPLIHVPESLKDTERVPVLVVLHDMGGTKQALMDGGWKELSEELGVALVVPGGMKHAGTDLSEGAMWFNNLGEYMQRYWTFEKPLTKGLDALKKAGKKLARGEVYLAGIGQGGFVGMTAAVRAPSLYKGVISFDSAIALELVAKKAAKAGEAGFQAAMFVSDKMFGVPPVDIDRACSMMSGTIVEWGIGEAIQRMKPTESLEKERIALVKKTITEWRQPAPEEPEPVEAGAPK